MKRDRTELVLIALLMIATVAQAAFMIWLWVSPEF